MVRKITILLLPIILLTNCSEENSTGNNTSNLPGVWIEKAEMPIGAQEIFPAVLEGKIYVVAGLASQTQVTKHVYVYDPSTDTWSRAADFPFYRHHVAIASYNGKLYAFGGFQGIGIECVTVGEVFEYDPSTEIWTQKTSMPTARGAGGAVTYNGKIYLIGGRSIHPDINYNTVEAYDPVNDTWETLSPMPIPCLHSGYALIGDLIYVIAGRQLDANGSETINISEMQVYSPADDEWQLLTDLPRQSSGLAAASLNGKLYAMGGEMPFGGNAEIYWENYEYDPVTNSWREVAKLLIPRHGTGAVTMGNYIYLIGGARRPAFGTTPINHAFTID
ncbi:MAG: hypothetical protein A2V66_04095 [Ignavibacteria bacterium RBG_13_36_8]|nr:MAG: hypothetical protein A2V66_04095 [Ignavibacteria bacterium RBG_13_36_8]